MKSQFSGIKVKALAGVIRGVETVNRQASRMSRFLSSFVLHGVGDREIEELTVRVYDDRGTYRESGIFDWEESWFQRDLPPAPAKILIGAAGTGREARYLREQGYEVVAFEPAPAFVRRARELERGGGAVFLQGSYEDLADPERAATGELLARVQECGPYDAVILGWGSYAHVKSPQIRVQLLRRMRELCPGGPVLASFFMQRESGKPEESRMERLGRRCGQWVYRRRTGEMKEVQVGDFFLMHAGFAHAYGMEELVGIAEAAGYQLRGREGLDGRVYPHCTFVPG